MKIIISKSWKSNYSLFSILAVSVFLWINAAFLFLVAHVKSWGISTRHILCVRNQIPHEVFWNKYPEAILRINWFKRRGTKTLMWLFSYFLTFSLYLFYYFCLFIYLFIFGCSFFLNFIFLQVCSVPCLTSYITILHTLNNKLSHFLPFFLFKKKILLTFVF